MHHILKLRKLDKKLALFMLKNLTQSMKGNKTSSQKFLETWEKNKTKYQN